MTLFLAQRTVGDERRDLELSQVSSQLLGSGAAVDEHQSFFAAVQPGDHHRGVLQRTDEVQGDFCCGTAGGIRRQEDPFISLTMPGQPLDQILRIADGGGEPDAL